SRPAPAAPQPRPASGSTRNAPWLLPGSRVPRGPYRSSEVDRPSSPAAPPREGAAAPNRSGPAPRPRHPSAVLLSRNRSGIAASSAPRKRATGWSEDGLEQPADQPTDTATDVSQVRPADPVLREVAQLGADPAVVVVHQRRQRLDPV